MEPSQPDNKSEAFGPVKNSPIPSSLNQVENSHLGDQEQNTQRPPSSKKSDIFQKCYNLLKNFSNLDPKQKRNVGNDFISLIDDNMDEASELFFEFIELFDSDPKLQSSKEEFEQSFKGDLNKMKAQKLLPIKLGQLTLMLKEPHDNSDKAQKEMAQIFAEICQIDPKQAYELFNSFEEVFEKTPRLMAVKDQYWNDMNKHIEPFIVKGNYTLLEKINNIEVYKKETETLDRSEMPHVRNLLVVGETGSGKSTLLNSMTTYLLGINYFDSVRVKTIVENSRVSQSHTQTLQVTEYIVKPDAKRFRYPIRLIDTPGFGDTRGLEYDQQNTQKIWKYIQETKINIHGICFVMKGTTNRITCIQQYIVQQILGLFGKDVEENFIGMITFADSQTTLAVKAIQDGKVPVKKIFKFNNSAFFPSKTVDDDSKLNQMYWEMSLKNFKQFFDYLLTITPASFERTKQCIKVKKTLELKIKAIEDKISEGINERRNLEKQFEIVDMNKEKINNNESFSYEEDYTESIQINKPSGEYTTNCLKCKTACHTNCVYKEDADKWECTAMKNGNCTVCPGKCEWKDHRNLGYYFEKMQKSRPVTWDNIKKNYYEGVKGIKSAERISNVIESKKKEVTNTIISDIKERQLNLELLNQISRKSLKVKESDYIQMMIKVEKEEKKEGYIDRIYQMKQIKNQYRTMENLQNPQAIFNTAEIDGILKDVEVHKKTIKSKIK